MAALITVADLALWTQDQIDDADTYAIAITEGASLKVRNYCGHPEWGVDVSVVVPEMAVFVTKMVASRAWLNGINGEAGGSTGPLSYRLIEEFASGMQFTEQEMLDLTGLSAKAGKGRGFWIQPLNRGPLEAVGHRYDDSGSDWSVPMIDGSDVYALSDEERAAVLAGYYAGS